MLDWAARSADLELGVVLADAPLQPFSVVGGNVEGPGYGRSRAVAAGTDGAHELRPALLVDHDDGQAGPDRHDGLGLVGLVAVADGPDQRGRDQVDA